MIDPKMLELSVYDGIPHLLAPVVTEPHKAVVALKWAVREMEDRYRAHVAARRAQHRGLQRAARRGAQQGRGADPQGADRLRSRDAASRSSRTSRSTSTPLPFIVVIVDEMADLMLVAGKEIEAAVQRLAQMARAAGIHLIMATQRPSVDVITGTIKANFPTRISFQVTSKIDSRTILGEQGAEQLLGQGDMLYMAGGGRITRVHGPFVVRRRGRGGRRATCKAQGEPDYIEAVTEDPDGEDGRRRPPGEGERRRAATSSTTRRSRWSRASARPRPASSSATCRSATTAPPASSSAWSARAWSARANHVGKREVLARDIDDRER